MSLIVNSLDEINDTVNNLNIGVMMTSYYFDADDYSSPIKVDINNDNEYFTANDFIRLAQIKAKQNIVSDITNYLPLASSSQLSYFSVNESARDLIYSPGDSTIFRLIFTLNSKYNSN